MVRVPIVDACERSTDTPEDAGLPPPHWYNVFFAEPGDAVGKLLISTEVREGEPLYLMFSRWGVLVFSC